VLEGVCPQFRHGSTFGSTNDGYRGHDTGGMGGCSSPSGSHKLNIKKLVGQGYEGAAAMSDHINVVQANTSGSRSLKWGAYVATVHSSIMKLSIDYQVVEW